MSDDFSNSVILPENLPTLEAAAFQRVDPKYLKLLYINHLIWGVFILALLAFFYFLPKEKVLDLSVWIAAGLAAGVLAYSLVITRLSFSKRGYLVREKDIAYERGLIRYRLTSIPFNRIQHVELIQTVIAKKMGLATLKIYTAGSSSDDLVIPGLPVETATRIREFLTGKISPDEQD